jgi:pimeloyl-ACP methyl ester carboxylesterase
MATFLVAHGAWSAGWAWKKIRPLLREKGHEIFTPTYTGLGERAHLLTPEVDLETHIQDVLAVLECEDLRDVILVGHSYGGMVATGAADRAPERIARLVYLDAFAPRDGQSMLDLGSPTGLKDLGRDDWRVPPNPLPPDTSASDAAWIAPRRFAQPRKSLEQPIRLTGAVEKLPRTYVYCTRPAPSDSFRQFAERAKKEGWQYLQIDASHNPHITNPGALAQIFDRIASGRS